MMCLKVVLRMVVVGVVVVVVVVVMVAAAVGDDDVDELHSTCTCHWQSVRHEVFGYGSFAAPGIHHIVTL
jgi:hypothetical protein